MNHDNITRIIDWMRTHDFLDVECEKAIEELNGLTANLTALQDQVRSLEKHEAELTKIREAQSKRIAELNNNITLGNAEVELQTKRVAEMVARAEKAEAEASTARKAAKNAAEIGLEHFDRREQAEARVKELESMKKPSLVDHISAVAEACKTNNKSIRIYEGWIAMDDKHEGVCYPSPAEAAALLAPGETKDEPVNPAGFDRTCECCGHRYCTTVDTSVRCQACCVDCFRPQGQSGWVHGPHCPLVTKTKPAPVDAMLRESDSHEQTIPLPAECNNGMEDAPEMRAMPVTELSRCQDCGELRHDGSCHVRGGVVGSSHPMQKEADEKWMRYKQEQPVAPETFAWCAECGKVKPLGERRGNRQLCAECAGKEQLAAAERRAFAVEEQGCPRCGSYQDVERKLAAAEARAEALQQEANELRRGRDELKENITELPKNQRLHIAIITHWKLT